MNAHNLVHAVELPPTSERLAPRRTFSRRVSCRRGTTTLEAIMAISMMVLLWVGIVFLGRLHIHRLHAQSHARACAFRIASDSCRTVFADCTAAQNQAPTPEGQNTLSQSSEEATSAADYAAPINDELQAQLKTGLFARIQTSSSHTLDQPPVLGAEQVTVGGTFSLPCDPKPDSVTGKIEEMFLDMFKKLRKEQ